MNGTHSYTWSQCSLVPNLLGGSSSSVVVVMMRRMIRAVEYWVRYT